MAVIDDSESRGFLFQYEKLFGAKAKTRADIEHEQKGEETGIDRTRRLFYVICSRAKSSLAIVQYTDDPDAVKRDVIDEKKWLDADEVVML
ncbi:MAG: hypothetical protein HQL87_15920 [Magnetococcales bacterium]|nr:hypothetical protein [Magnetococcales bacterium]